MKNTKKKIDLDMSKADNFQIAGVDMRDYPDFCDAFIESCDIDGRDATDEELDIINEECPDLIHELAHQFLC